MKKNIEILNSFTLENIPNLDTVVLGALELFMEKLPPTSFGIPKINLNKYKRPLVVGSGNAEATGKIIFKNTDAVFASENNFEEKLKNIKEIDGVVLISASGGKHAISIAKVSKQYSKNITLITNKQDSHALKELNLSLGDEEYVFPKNREPYTYNTSTYMGMILGSTSENPERISNFIETNISKISFSRLASYDKFFLIVPTKFYGITRMLEVKFVELFGRNIGREVATEESITHAMTVVPARELFISFGVENKTWGKEEDRMFIPLSENADYGEMMAVGYYVIGKIQEQHHQYFKENIVEYVKNSSLVFGHEIKAIVE